MPRKTAGAAPSAAVAGAGAPLQDIEPATRVLRRFRLVFNAVRTHFQQIEKQVGVGGAQVWALSVIEAQPGIGVGSLAQAMDIHQTTASNLVKSMVQAGLVSTQRDPVDRRATRLAIAPRGTEILRKAPGPMSGVLPAALAALDDETLARLDGDLAKLLDKLNTDGRAAGIPLAQM
jgi:DNA-binding MarR family transcriptional regulator